MTLRGGVRYVVAEGGLHQGVALVAVCASTTRERKRLVGYALECRFTPSLCIPPLVTARIRMKLRRTDRQQTGHRSFDVNKLDDPAVKKSYLVQLKNRYQALVELDDHTNNNVDEINSLWNTVKKSYQGTSKEIMGHREKKHKEWISQEAWQEIEERRNIKQKLLGIKSERLKEQQKQVYKEADRTVKQLTRRDKRKYLEDIATQAEETALK